MLTYIVVLSWVKSIRHTRPYVYFLFVCVCMVFFSLVFCIVIIIITLFSLFFFFLSFFVCIHGKYKFKWVAENKKMVSRSRAPMHTHIGCTILKRDRDDKGAFDTDRSAWNARSLCNRHFYHLSSFQNRTTNSYCFEHGFGQSSFLFSASQKCANIIHNFILYFVYECALCCAIHTIIMN